MSKAKVKISIQTVQDITATHFGGAFMKTLIACDERLTPQQLSLSESYKDPFTTIEEFSAKWWAIHAVMTGGKSSPFESYWGPYWRRTSAIRSNGFVDHGFVNKKNKTIPSRIYFDSQWRQKVDFFSLFSSWCRLVQPEIAMLHLFTEEEQSEISMTDPRHLFEMGDFGGPKDPGVPNMAWAMAFGGKYLNQMDIAGIKSAGYKIDTFETGYIIRVTDNLYDVKKDFVSFSEKRKNLKTFYPEDFFRIKD